MNYCKEYDCLQRPKARGYCEMHQPGPLKLSAVILGIIIVVAIYCAFGALTGLLSSMDARENARKDGCVYRSLLAYINPGYIGMCELARARFNVDQPVEYVPKDVKELKSI